MIRRFLNRGKAAVASPAEYIYLNPLDMPALPREEVLAAGRTGIWYETGTALRPMHRTPPRFVDDPDGTGLFHAGDVEAARIMYPPAVSISGVDVDLVGYRSFLTRERRFFTDEALLSERREDALKVDRRDRWLEQLRHPAREMNEETGFAATAWADTFSLARDLSTSERIDGRTVALVSQEPFNYGSFLFRVLAKIANLEALGITDERVLVHMPFASMREALVLAGIGESRLVPQDYKRSYHLPHVIVPGNRNGDALLDNETVALFARLREASGYSHDGRKLYVARNRPGTESAWNGRAILNEAVLIERLLPLGFQIVVPGELSMVEQIRTFASAGMVVGGSGSALFNAVFCRPGTQLIDIESEIYWINAHLCLFSSAGLDFGIFVGKADTSTTAVHRPLTVDIDALVDRISRFAA